MKTNYDAIIIGSGIIGCSIAFELSKKGWKTLNVDKLTSAGSGSTANTCAVIRVHYSTLDGTAVAYESYHYWDNWRGYLGVEDPQGLAGFNKTGVLVFESRVNDNLKKIKQMMEVLGIAYQNWDVPKIKTKFPMLDDTSYYPPRRPEDPEFGKKNEAPITGAIYYPEGGYISDPVLSVHNVQVAAEAHGAEFLFNSKVVDILKQNQCVHGVQLEGGEVVQAPVVVNAAGPHSFVVNAMAGVIAGMKIKTRALRHEVVHLPAPDGIDYEVIGCPSSDSDVGAYWRPEVGNHILSGSEDPDCDPKEWIEDPDDFNRNLTEQAKAQAYRLSLRIPDLRIPNQIQGVVDLYDVADDWIPIYDKSDLTGFYMAVGTSGNQYKNAPVVGKMMAELILKCQNGHDHDKDPVIFHLEKLDRDINLRFYSRLREINTESSFSVLG
ncbi:MAG: FAD-binding oxidoreductase [Deltaproteobacteria bacterium]|nr:FAD-binding oxidoreductase [Deltaproteobacteria bacterium]MBW2676651.1 FAD-binding oxidoreductase [Deltaproteobacteria bacterium]